MTTPTDRRPNTTEILPFAEYDKIIVSFSGGKDSLACVLDLLERGVPREQIELWHHLVDGKPGSDDFADWPVTTDYVRKVGEALGIDVRFQWREGGFEQELLRQNAQKQPVAFELTDGTVGRNQTRAPRSDSGWSRRRWPAKAADLGTRWCSAFLKIEVGRSAIANDPRFQDGAKVLFITGERREESTNRSRYAEAEVHASSCNSRRIDQWRSILDWSEQQVWAIIERWSVRPHPAYELGFGRVSCMTCIFASKHQWATIKAIAPERFEKVAATEETLGHTINKGKSIRTLAAEGTSFVTSEEQATAALALAQTFTAPIIANQWTLPKGAFAGTIGGAP